MPVIPHGPAYSTHACTARLALEEKGVTHELNEADIPSGKGQAPEHLARQPRGKVPAFEHDGFQLFETFAIAGYVDETFSAPKPAGPKARARMTRICGIVDSYAYGAMVGKVCWQHVVVPMPGGTSDAAVTTEGLIGGDLPCGGQVTLADLYLLPVAEYFRMVDAGAKAFATRPKLAAW